MRIACLQFTPQLGDVDNNLNRADAVLSRANPRDLDLLVLPELAFSGYNFKSLRHISPYLEHTASGITSLWARTTALKYDCVVTVGYPEKVDVSERWPASPEYYNSAITVNADGETIANYRKTFLYYRDETWALEGPDGFYDGEIPGLGNVAMGICMDLNPYKFEAPWTAWEFAYHVLHRKANLVILSMAWMTQQDFSVYSRKSKEPDIDTLSYWVSRLEPIIRAEDIGEIIVVLANRCGTEGEAIYAGTSCILGIEGGEVKVYGILGRGEKELLVVDTTDPPKFKLVAEPDSSIPEDTLQSRNAPAMLEPEQAPPARRETRDDTPYPSDTRTQGREGLVASIDTVLSEVAAVSPVNYTRAHAFFGPERPPARERLEKLRSSITESESQSPTTSILSSVQLPVPILKDPIPPRTGTPRSGTSSRDKCAADRRAERRSERRSERSVDCSSDKPLVPAKQPSEMLQVTTLDNWVTKNKDDPPDSASSTRVNTPWEPSSAIFRAEEIIKIMKAPSPPIMSGTMQASPPNAPVPPKPRSSSSSNAYIPIIPIATSVKQASTTILPILSSSKHASPPVTIPYIPSMERPRSPKSRNTSRSRTPHKEPALASQDLINEPAIASIIAPFDTIEINRSRQDASDPSAEPSPEGSLAARDERSMSPRPRSTGW